MHCFGSRALLAILFCLSASDATRAAVSALQYVTGGLAWPIEVLSPPGDRDRLFIVQNGGDGTEDYDVSIRIFNLKTGMLEPTPFLTIPGVNSSGEGGVLGVAFHPDYNSPDPNNPGRGKLYINMTANDSDPNTYVTSYVREYSVSANPNIANTTFKPIIEYGQPQANHKGGWMGFGPSDGYLYISTGDGGNGDDIGPGHSTLPDASGNAQDLTNNLLGKMLRIDVNGDDFPGTTPEALAKHYAIPPTNPFVGKTGDDEIWAYGLRNPFRASFDRVTHDLWIGDVGQDDREEIDHQPASSTGGENYGWHFREGEIATPTPVGSPVGGAEPPNYVPPVYTYTHANTVVGPASPAGFDGNVLTGGFVYRGPDPSLQGKYFFFDAVSHNYWMADAYPFGNVQNINSLLTPDVGSPQLPVSFGEDDVGNLYIAYFASGEIYRIATNQLLKGDFDADGDVDNDDYVKFRASFGAATINPAADGNGNAAFDLADFVAWRKNVGASVRAGVGSGTGSLVPEPQSSAMLVTFAPTIVLLAGRTRRR